jgi:hypothetical protein
VRETCERLPQETRSGFLSTAARSGAAVLVGLAIRPGVAAASSSSNDVAISTLRLRSVPQASFYLEAERIGALHGALAHRANVVGVHERDHVKAFKSVIHSRWRRATRPGSGDWRDSFPRQRRLMTAE